MKRCLLHIMVLCRVALFEIINTHLYMVKYIRLEETVGIQYVIIVKQWKKRVSKHG